MIIGDLNDIAGRTYPAQRLTQNLVGGASPVQCDNFAMGFVTLDPNGGQVPWHNQEQEEVVRAETAFLLFREQAEQDRFSPSAIEHPLFLKLIDQTRSSPEKC